METRRVVSGLIGMVAGMLLGALIITGWHAVRYDQYDNDRRASDQCWVDGGDYRDGSCVMPKDTRTDEMKVCEALNGGFTIVRDKATGAEVFTCYDLEGKVKVLPDLTNKTVDITPSGTIVLGTK